MDEKQAITSVFNLVANRYDNPALRFFPACAEKLTDIVTINPGDHVLDIATGTGVVALAAAIKTGQQGQVQAIDLSENMLNEAKQKCHNAGLDNIKFHVMDAEKPEFADNTFDVITCSYGLFFLPDMSVALQNWLRILKPGGQLIFSSFAPSAFQPLSDTFIKNLADYDIIPPTPRWLQLAEEKLCKQILLDNGFIEPRVEQSQLGYPLEDFEQWWDAIKSAGYRGLYEQLPEENREEFKQQHQRDIDKHKTDNGIWMDVQTLFTTATKPR